MKRETIEYRGYEITTHYDEDASNPRTEWDNLCTIAYKHSRYTLGEEKIDDPVEWLGEKLDMDIDDLYEYAKKNGGFDSPYNNTIKEQLQSKLEELVVISPLYLYDHSGITISMGGFSCPWDSGQVGYIYCTLETAIKNWNLPKDSTWDTKIDDWYYKGQQVTLRDAIQRCMEGEVETFDQYLTGEVYGYDSECGGCWGFFGDEGYKDMIEKAKGEIDYEINKKKSEHFNRMKTWIKNHVPLYVRESNPYLI